MVSGIQTENFSKLISKYLACDNFIFCLCAYCAGFFFLFLFFGGQLLYFLLYCNFRKASQIWRTGNRKMFVMSDTKERMSRKGVNSLKLTKKGKKNAGFAWR